MPEICPICKTELLGGEYCPHCKRRVLDEKLAATVRMLEGAINGWRAEVERLKAIVALREPSEVELRKARKSHERGAGGVR